MSNIPQRKQIRLKDYDYSRNGVYFITVCAKNRNNLFADIDAVGAASCRPRLTKIGTVIDGEIVILSNLFEYVTVENYVIMPNHIHMLLSINNEGGRQDAAPTSEYSCKKQDCLPYCKKVFTNIPKFDITYIRNIS